MEPIFDYIFKYFSLIRISDIVDIVIVAVIIYFLIKLIRETRAIQLVRGIIVLCIVYFFSEILHLNVLNYILGGTMQIGAFALVVLFQPELRSMLERMGRINVGNIIDFNNTSNTDPFHSTIKSIVTAAVNMSHTKTGALIVVEKDTRLGDVMSTGTMLNADVSSNLLENIFVPNTPLHDGAVIIRNNKIMTAGCFLPLTSNYNLSSELGTRHRAALGISEASDAIVIVVSEETGKISLAKGGALTRNLTGESLTKALTKLLSKQPENPVSNNALDKLIFWRTK